MSICVSPYWTDSVLSPRIKVVAKSISFRHICNLDPDLLDRPRRKRIPSILGYPLRVLEVNGGHTSA